jgi:hypothetical protein
MVSDLPDGATGWCDQVVVLAAEDAALRAAGDGLDNPQIRQPAATMAIATYTIWGQ